MTQKYNVYIGQDGLLKFTYDDDLAPLLDLGETSISRASHVEPLGCSPGWYANLSLSGGPILGPFPLRAQALQAELTWLETHLQGQPT